MQKNLPDSKPSESTKISKSRKWLFSVVLLVFIPIFLFLLLEIGLRLIRYGYPSGFFIKQKIHGQTVFTDNLKFGYRFFPPELARPSSRLSISVEKSPETIRIFVLGGSAAMGDPDFSFGFSRILDKMLQHEQPDRKFEVINAAVTAINSNVVLPIARDCARLQPDLFIIYLGNNEVIGPYGPGTVFAPFASNLGLLRANIFLNRTKIGQLVSNVRQKIDFREDTSRTWGGVDMFIENRIRFDDPRMNAVYDHFRENLKDICAAAENAGAKVVFSTVAANLKSCAPFGSLHQPDLSESELNKWQDFYLSGIASENLGKTEKAIASFEKATEIDAEFADLQYRLARCYMVLGQTDSAKIHFTRARDFDALRFRADSQINEIIREVSQKTGVSFVDAAVNFQNETTDGIPGERWFYDHVHLNFSGNYLLARMIKKQVESVLKLENSGDSLSEDECKEMLAFSLWDQYRLENEILGRMKSPAFSGQLDNTEVLKRQIVKLDHLRAQMIPESLSQAIDCYQKAIKASPDDWVLRNNYGLLLSEAGNDAAGAIEQFRSVLRIFPYDYLTHNNLGLACARQGKLSDAIVCYNEALRIKPDFAKANFNLGEALERQGKYDEALLYFKKAKLPPQALAGIHVRIGKRMLRDGQTNGAAQQFETALSLASNHLDANLELASLRFSQNNFNQAITYYQAALRIKPDLPEVQNNLGLALCNLGNFENALPYFQQALQTTPDYFDARNNLAGVLSQLGRSEEAIAQLQYLLKLNPNNPGLHNNLGGQLLRLGRTNEAIACFKRALQFNPDLQSAKRNLVIAGKRMEGK